MSFAPVAFSPWWRFPLALMLLEVVVYLSQDMYLPALPVVQAWFGVDPPAAQFSVAAWSSGAALVQLVTGPASDRLGRRVVLLAGVAGFALSCLACALTAGYRGFLAARVAEGCAGIWAISAGYAGIHELFEARTAIRIQAWMNSVTVLAPALGPALGAGLMLVAPWQGMFVLLGAAAGALFLLLWRWMPETVDAAGRAPVSARRVAASYVALLRNGPLMCLLGVWCLVFTVMVVWSVSGPFLLRDQRGGASGFVWAQLYACGSYIAGTRLVARMLHLYPREVLLGAALDICLGGIGATLLAALLLAPVMVVVGLYGVFMLGAGLLMAPLFRAVLERAHQDMGLRVAWLSSVINATGAIASALAALLDVGQFRAFGGLGLLAVLGARQLARSRRGLAASLGAA